MADSGGSSSSCYEPCLDTPAVLKWVKVPLFRLDFIRLFLLECGVLTWCFGSASLQTPTSCWVSFELHWKRKKSARQFYRCLEFGRVIITKFPVQQLILCTASKRDCVVYLWAVLPFCRNSLSQLIPWWEGINGTFNFCVLKKRIQIEFKICKTSMISLTHDHTF